MRIKPIKPHLLLAFVSLLFTGGYSQTNGDPPEMNATLINEFYCPETEKPIVDTFTLTDPDTTPIDGIFIQISTGYNNAEDRLYYRGSNNNITDNWNVTEGKLKLSLANPTSNYQTFIDAIREVVYTNSNPNPTGTREFSITLDEANYLPSNGHYYEYISAPIISWQNAKTEAATRSYYGLQGYLVTITSAEESQLVGEQATGQGWIGGSDEEDDYTWKWMTGPETGSSFWFGLSNGNNIGADYTFTNWNTGEPNNWENNVVGVSHAEDYLHIYSTGKWNDYPNSNSAILGYFVEYGGMPGDPVLNNTASTRIVIGERVTPPNTIPPLQVCDDATDGDDTNRQAVFDLTEREPTLLNGKNDADFSFSYFEDLARTVPIPNPTNYYTISTNNQTVYVEIANNSDLTCRTNTEIVLEVISLPIIQSSITLKNCDEDGTPDGYTDFNLTEADELITLNDPTLTVSYFLTLAEAEVGLTPINPTPFNSSVSNTVFARVENAFGCYRIASLNLEVSTTQFTPGYVYELNTCENDTENDGIATFDLTQASTELLNQLPTGQNLSIHYYRTTSDAQLELNEITQQDSYRNETPLNQTLIIRVENTDNGDCYDIGPFVSLTVFERPEIRVIPEGTVCLNNPPLDLNILYSNGETYEWKDPNGVVISTTDFAQAFEGGVYSVTAFSDTGCASFTQNITVTTSELATISIDHITVVDDSENNSISIDTSNLGLGDYEFALNDSNGFYQDESYFDMLTAGIHTVYVRDKNGCGAVGVEVSVIGFPKFFTPNNDGYNDTWQVQGLSDDFYPASLIYIFDRFGKLILQIDPFGNGWDGSFNGILLPASDYWFSVQLMDKNNNIRERKGHFSLIRR